MIQNTLIINNGIDTSDATATASDILSGKTAYVNGSKITGNYIALDTSDATATADDIANGITAYVDGQKITGNVRIIGSSSVLDASTTYLPSLTTSGSNAGKICIQGKLSNPAIFRAGGSIFTYSDPSSFGDATAADVASGKTFTSAEGLKVAGTLNAGFVTQVQGSGTSYIRIPGLTSIPNYIVVFAHDMISTLDVMQACYFSKSATIGTQGFNFLQLYCNRSGYSTYNMRASTIGLVSSSELENGIGYYYDSSAFYLCVSSGRIFNSATTYTCLAG